MTQIEKYVAEQLEEAVVKLYTMLHVLDPTIPDNKPIDENHFEDCIDQLNKVKNYQDFLLLPTKVLYSSSLKHFIQ